MEKKEESVGVGVDGEEEREQASKKVGQPNGWAGVIFLDNPVCNPTLFNPT